MSNVVIEGMEVVIERDLELHKTLLARTTVELQAFRDGRSHEIRRKKYYRSLLGGGKYNDDALRSSMDQIALNIRHMSDKIDAAEQKIFHHKLIVDTLTEQLRVQKLGLEALAEYRRTHGSRG